MGQTRIGPLHLLEQGAPFHRCGDLVAVTLEQAKPKIVFEILDQAADGRLFGKVERSLVVNSTSDPHCVLCTDDRKNQPKVGLEIIRGGKKADGKDVWEGGKILDPENGKEYSLRLTPTDGGRRLEVRGYIGAPILGRTQVWNRIR